MANTILIVEEALRDLKSHWFGYIQTITRTAEVLGWQVEVACHQDAVPEIRKELKVFPIFRYAKYLDNEKRLAGERYYGFLLHSLRCLVVLWPLLKKQPRYDRIFVPTVLVHHLLAWWIIMQYHPRKPKHLTLFFLGRLGTWDRQRQTSILIESPACRIERFLLKLFQPLVQKGIVMFAVETKGAQREFEELTGLPFKLLPHPVPEFRKTNQSIIHPEPKQMKAGCLTFACYGFARYEKGSDVLKTAVEQLLSQQQCSNVQFCIQWVEPFAMPDGTICDPNSLLSQFDQVKLIDRPFNSDEYQVLLQNTDCMILPYRNSSYYARVSRVAVEAMCLGIPVIYTKGGWLEEVVEEFGVGIGIEDEDTNGLMEAIVKLSHNYNFYHQAALDKQQQAINYFSGELFCQLFFSNPDDCS